MSKKNKNIQTSTKFKADILINISEIKWKEEITNIIGFIKKVAKKIPYQKNCSISIVLANDLLIQQLNYNYRKKNQPTNVLAFPISDNFTEDIGEIIISLDTVKKEAGQQDISLTAHTAHMVIHGILHLLGYDHETEEEAEVMEKHEIDILHQLNINNPYN